MSHQQIIEIKQWLSTRYITVPLEWVEACVTFLAQEYKDACLSLQRLKNHVYEQWLVSDLQEIGVSVLPQGLSSCQKTVLNGVFVLQVNGIRDVGKPAYSQLRQLEGRINADEEVSATPRAAVPEWEAKPTRMLILTLTDGVSTIQGMEYQPITALSPNLSPGVKVLIKGPLECRFGHLLLTAGKIEILGGEVERYQEKYSREQILRDALQQNLTADEQQGRSDRNEVNYRQPSANRNNTFNNDHDNYNEQRHSSSIQRNSSVNITPINNSSASDIPENFDCIDDDDDFIQDLDCSVLDEIERANSQQTSLPTDTQEENLRADHLPKQVQCGEVTRNEESIINDDRPPTDSVHHRNCSLSAPFTYLNDIPKNEYIRKEFLITIEGSISKVLSKLECKAIGGWRLTARVNDSKSFIDAEFHDKVLEEFVGISAKDMMAMQTQARNDPKIHEKVTSAITNFKKKLQQLQCLMEVKFCPDKMPCVVKCIENST